MKPQTEAKKEKKTRTPRPQKPLEQMTPTERAIYDKEQEIKRIREGEKAEKKKAAQAKKDLKASRDAYLAQEEGLVERIQKLIYEYRKLGKKDSIGMDVIGQIKKVCSEMPEREEKIIEQYTKTM